MANIESLEFLGKDVKDMTDEELRYFIRHSRGRRIAPEPTEKRKSIKKAIASRKPKPAAKQDIKKMAAEMTVEEMRAVLSDLLPTQGKR